jgi:hypothetical protein
MKMASKASFFSGVFRASAWIGVVFFVLCLSLLSPIEVMSRLMVSVVSVFENWENLPASAPTSMTVFACDRLMEVWMKWVSICVRYLPMRVFAACSQWVSVEMFSAKTGSLQGFYLSGFTSTSSGTSESFLLHLGHCPLYSERISSGGLSSSPSYRM